MKFLRNVLAAVIGFFVAMGILFLVFFLFIGIASMGNDDDVVTVKENSVLKLNLSLPIKDHLKKPDPIEEAFDLGAKGYDLEKLLNAIEYAETDDKIKGISIHENITMAGMAQTKALRDALVKFKESGKFIYAYGDFFTQKDYYLTTVADSIFLNPMGNIDFGGLSSEVMYYKEAQEKSGIKMEVIRHGKYKSAVEPYLENEMSEANREQISELLKSIWGEMLTEIGASRKLSIDQLNTIADDLGARNPELAKQNGIIDDIAYLDEYESSLRSILEIDSKDEISSVDIEDYLKKAKKKKEKDAEKIAVLYAQGTIMYARGNEDIIGQGVMIEAIRDLKEDEDIKAVVLRVDSPGGSALASELIWRELEALKEEKPLIVSMGNVAASGGYYIACNSHKIIAEPSTITGSIGVFGTLPNFKGLADKWGFNAEQVTTNRQSTGYSVFEPLSDEFRGVIQEGIEGTYDTFLQRVADGRGMTKEQVNEVAQGRVWTGTDALQIGLVDELGGLEVALQRASEAAELTTYRTVNYPKFKKDPKDIFGGLSPFGQAKTKILEEELGAEAYKMLQDIKMMSQQKGIQAKLPFEINIH